MTEQLYLPLMSGEVIFINTPDEKIKQFLSRFSVFNPSIIAKSKTVTIVQDLPVNVITQLCEDLTPVDCIHPLN